MARLLRKYKRSHYLVGITYRAIDLPGLRGGALKDTQSFLYEEGDSRHLGVMLLLATDDAMLLCLIGPTTEMYSSLLPDFLMIRKIGGQTFITVHGHS